MIKKALLPLLQIFCYSSLFSQTVDSSVYYYNLGNQALSSRNLILADSLYTKSLNLLKHPDTYYNRAVVRKASKNYIGYCGDIQGAAVLGDSIANDEFWKSCGKVDTIHYLNDTSKVDSGEYAILKQGLYNDYIEYKKLDKKGIVLLHYLVDCKDTIYLGGKELEGTELVETELEETELEKSSELLQYVVRKITYPQLAKENGVQGTVIITFVVNQKGEMENPTVTKGLPLGLSEEALSVVKSLPSWKTPKMYKGKPIKIRYDVPIKFTLK